MDLGNRGFIPNAHALQSLVDWMLVRHLITLMRRSQSTTQIFEKFEVEVTLTDNQKQIVHALQKIYENDKHKIYSIFATEDMSVQMFHANVRKCIDNKDFHGLWFVLLAFATATNKHMMKTCKQILGHPEPFLATWRQHGANILQTQSENVFTSCTHRGNLPMTERKIFFQKSVDRLCSKTPILMKNTWASVASGNTALDKALWRW